MVRVRFKPLKISKRRWRQPWLSIPSDNDLEKEPIAGSSLDLDNDELSSTSSAGSSRATSISYDSRDGMLQKRSNIKQSASAYAPQRRCNRRFTCCLGAFLIVFLLTLTNLHFVSVEQVRSHEYVHQDQNRTWEEFALLDRFYGGIKSLISASSNQPEFPSSLDEVIQHLEENGGSRNLTSAVFHPSISQQINSASDFTSGLAPITISNVRDRHDCFIDLERKIRVPSIYAYNGTVQGFPDQAVGSSRLLNLTSGQCFDRFGKLGAYGFGYSQKLGGTGAGLDGDREGAHLVWNDHPEVDYRKVQWAKSQQQCEEANMYRFQNGRSTQNIETQTQDTERNHTQSRRNEPHVPSRTAVIIRTWSDYQYDVEDIIHLRALISELVLSTGAEYSVHFLIHVKDDNLQIWSDEATQQRVLNDSLPDEFRGLGTLWSERQMGLIYGDLEEPYHENSPVHGHARGAFLALQHFANEHPEFEHFWNIEMDVRFTGHFYQLLGNSGQWAKDQPRKGLWERNARFYVPSKHGSWDDFRHMARVQNEHGTNSKNNMWSGFRTHSDPLEAHKNGRNSMIWGPQPPLWDDVGDDMDCQAPKVQEQDQYEWGVGEEADLVTFAPIFNPRDTNWPLSDDVSGYNTTLKDIPRRTSLGTTIRISKTLLNVMHRETALKRHRMASEMWPASCALHHGLKAVYVPHPVYIDRQWPTDYLAAVLDGGLDGASGGARTSVFNEQRDHNLEGLSWSSSSSFAERLWKRWLGFKVDGAGGEEWEVATEGRMCLPAMLLHPVKQVNLVYEHSESHR